MNLLDLLHSPLGRAHRRLHNVWLHDVADRLRQRRKAIAASTGLDPTDVETYPISGDVTVVNNQQGGLWKVALISAMLLALGAAGGWMGARLAGLPATSLQEPSSATQAQQYKVTFWAEDGGEIDVQQDRPQDRR